MREGGVWWVWWERVVSGEGGWGLVGEGGVWWGRLPSESCVLRGTGSPLPAAPHQLEGTQVCD